MVLDGAVDPSLDSATAAAQQAGGFETDLHGFFAWCAQNDSCRNGLHGAPATTYAALFARLKKGHALGSVDYGVALEGVLAALYSPQTWPILGEALSRAERGDGTNLALLANALAGVNADGSFSNIVSANTATSCVDFPAPTTIGEHAALAKRLAKSAPDFGAAEAWSGLACHYWPAQGPKHASAAHVRGAPPLLVVGSTGDPATPYAWAKALVRQLPGATLLTRTGDGHTGYLASSCIRTWADRYLETLKMPPAGTVCASD
jgi:hypothetical protein